MLINLENKKKPTWEDTKTRLDVAAESLRYPYFILFAAGSDLATAWKSFDAWAEYEYFYQDELENAEAIWDALAVEIPDLDTAKTKMHNWLHRPSTN